MPVESPISADNAREPLSPAAPEHRLAHIGPSRAARHRPAASAEAHDSALCTYVGVLRPHSSETGDGSNRHPERERCDEGKDDASGPVAADEEDNGGRQEGEAAHTLDRNRPTQPPPKSALLARRAAGHGLHNASAHE